MTDLQKLVRPEILSLVPYSSARDEFNNNGTVFLDANENPYGNLNRYPDPYQKELKSVLADLSKVSSANIFIGNGSDEVIDLALRIFCCPGQDKALAFYPGYSMYRVSAAINGVNLITLPLTADFQLDVRQIEPYLADDQLKLIFLCSPNNPTGNLLNQQDIEFILNNFAGLVVIDEAYIEFSETASWVAGLGKYPNLIISQTLSKAWGLAGARIGIAYASPEIISYFNKIKPPYNVSQPNQQAAISALSNRALFTRNNQLILQEREKLIEALKQLSIVKKIYPSAANFLLVEVKNADKAYQKLVARGIVVRNRSKEIKNCLRLTIGSRVENKLLLEALQNLIL